MATALERARALALLIEQNAAWAEELRTLPPETVRALADAGLFRFGLPRELGGRTRTSAPPSRCGKRSRAPTARRAGR